MIMVEASFNGILRTIVIVILAYYAIRFLLRIFAPVIVQQVVKKASENFQQQQQQYNNDTFQQPNPQMQDRPREKKKVGEYIDYEEIE